MCCSQRRRIIDTVAHHQNLASLACQCPTAPRLVFRRQVGVPFRNAQTLRHGLYGRDPVTGHDFQHQSSHRKAAQCLYGARTRIVLETETRQIPAVKRKHHFRSSVAVFHLRFIRAGKTAVAEPVGSRRRESLNTGAGNFTHRFVDR
ncbi:hypothetical protein D3C87_1502600 [compost metagenome]